MTAGIRRGIMTENNRKLIKNKKRFRILALLMAAAFALTPLYAAVPAEAEIHSKSMEELEIDADFALLYNPEEDLVYYEKNGYDKAYPASTTKVMTALLVCEALDRGDITLDQVVTASNTFSWGLTAGSASIHIQVGEELTVEQLLYSLLLPSANDAANVLAETVAGSRIDFVDLMNARAAELGCKHTHFMNAHGLNNDEHYTTAYELCMIFAEAMKHEQFRKVIGTAEYDIPATNKSAARHLENTNALLTDAYRPGYTYEYTIGGKTGTTNAAGVCLVCAAEKDGTMLYSVVLHGAVIYGTDGSETYRNFTETKKLFEWGFDAYSTQTLFEDGQVLGEVPVHYGLGTDKVSLVNVGEITKLIPTDADLSGLETTVDYKDDMLEAPVEAGVKLGTVTLKDADGEELGTLDLVTKEKVEKDEKAYRKDQLKDFFFHGVGLPLVLIAAALIAFRIWLGVTRRRRRRKARMRREQRRRARENDYYR